MPDQDTMKCPRCNGKGEIEERQWVQNASTNYQKKWYDFKGRCPVCNGDGHLHDPYKDKRIAQAQHRTRLY